MILQGIEIQSSLQRTRLGMQERISRLLRDEPGQDLVEYGLIAGLIGLAAVTSTHGVAVSVAGAINFVGSRLAAQF